MITAKFAAVCRRKTAQVGRSSTNRKPHWHERPGFTRLPPVPSARLHSRAGITLFEVLVALAIFLGALAGIAQIVDTGSTAAVTGQLQSEAVLRCETTLAEIVSGVHPLESVQREIYPDDSAWSWSLTVADGPHPDVIQLTVEVVHARTNGSTDATFTMTRLIRDPQLFLDAAAAAQEVE